MNSKSNVSTYRGNKKRFINSIVGLAHYTICNLPAYKIPINDNGKVISYILPHDACSHHQELKLKKELFLFTGSKIEGILILKT